MEAPERDPTVLRPNERRVLLIGWDAADWRVARPLMDEGKMPALKRLVETGVSGNLATIRPVLSPMLWTSIATGKRPFNHGIHGFTEPMPDGAGIRPVTNLSRSTKAIWNMLMQAGKRSVVVGWWPSHPAEPIDGVMVSNFYQHASAPIGKPWPMPKGTVWPESYRRKLEEFRFHPGELTAEHLAPFIPRVTEIDHTRDERAAMCAKIVAEVTSVHAAATALMQLEPWDLMAVYYDGIDHFGHGFMKYHPPQQEHISDSDFETYRHVVEAAYRWHDQILGALLALAGDDVTVVLISDHGFHPDHLRPKQLPAEPAGPAAEHGHYGVFVARGPGIAQGKQIHGASVLDVCPTLLTLFGLPVGADMDGSSLVTVLDDQPPEVERIASWDDLPGECGTHDPDALTDPAETAEVIRQLVELGYIEEPDEDSALAQRECLRELRYNLAMSYEDAGRYADAIALLEPLWDEWTTEHRFGIAYIECCGALRMLERRADAIRLLEDRMRSSAIDARSELERLRPELDKYKPDTADAEDDADKTEHDLTARTNQPPKPPRRLALRVRKLLALASPRPALIRWLDATQAIEEGRAEQAVGLLKALRDGERDHPGYHLQLGHAYRRLAKHDESERCYRRALEIDPDNAGAHLGLAMARLALGDAQGSIDAALSATELRFHLPRAHLVLGEALEQVGERDHAVQALRVAVAQAPGFAEAHATLARALESTGDSTDARYAERHRARAKELSEDQTWRRAVQRDDASTHAAEATHATNAMNSPEWFAPTPGDQSGWTEPHTGEPITVVSGLPRSGTSMMMQMLVAGGLKAVADGNRQADESNPRGYLEDDRVKRLAADASWVHAARGRVLKVVAPLLSYLPEGERYQIVFLERDPDEVMRSQRRMLDRSEHAGADLDDESLRNGLARQLVRARSFIQRSDRMRVCYMRYADVVDRPTEATERLAAFLGHSDSSTVLDRAAMAAAVDAGLRRERRDPSHSVG